MSGSGWKGQGMPRGGIAAAETLQYHKDRVGGEKGRGDVPRPRVPYWAWRAAELVAGTTKGKSEATPGFPAPRTQIQPRLP